MTERITAGRCGGPLGRRFELGDTLSAPAAVKIIYLFFIFLSFLWVCVVFEGNNYSIILT